MKTEGGRFFSLQLIHKSQLAVTLTGVLTQVAGLLSFTPVADMLQSYQVVVQFGESETGE